MQRTQNVRLSGGERWRANRVVRREADTQPSGSAATVLEARTGVIALLVSLLFHVVALAVWSRTTLVAEPSFWLMAGVDTVLWFVALIPLVAAARRRLVWYDPLVIAAAVFFGMICTFFLAILLDPTYAIYHTSVFGRSHFVFDKESRFFFLVAGAEAILGAFFLIVLMINRKPLVLVPYRPTAQESKAALITFVFWSFLGIIGWLIFWSGRSYLDAAIVNLGSEAVKVPEAGMARFAILTTLGVTSISLGLAGGSIFVSPKTRRISALLLLIVFAATVLVDLPSGSRINTVSGILFLLFIAAFFQYKVPSSVWVVTAVAVLVLLFSITVLRGNNSISYDSGVALRQLVTGEAGELYSASQDSPTEALFAADRVGPITLVLDQLGNGRPYLYGESLVAGWVDLVVPLEGAIGASGPVPIADRFLWANERILVWLFGSVISIGTIPPSIPGEFYMQAGLPSLIILSALFGWGLNWARRKLFSSSALFARWLLAIVVFRIVILLPTETSALAYNLAYLVPIAVVYGIVRVLVQHPSGSRWNPR